MRRFALVCFLAAAAPAWAQAPFDSDLEPSLHRALSSSAPRDDFRHAKTFFSWNTAERPAPEEGEDRIVTDRPHFSEASSLVGLGRVQLETGYTYFRDRNSGVLTQTHSFPEPLLRAGIFAEWFEFRLAYNALSEVASGPGVPRETHTGSDDLYIGAKLALTQQVGWLPEMALFPQMRAPSGDAYFTSGQVLPGFNFAYSWFLNDWIELECNTQLNRRRDDVDHYYTEFIQTANVEYDLAERWGGFTEFLAFVPSGAVAAESQYYFHGGFVYFVNDDIQLDVHAGLGLNDAADGLAFTGAGFSIRH